MWLSLPPVGRCSLLWSAQMVAGQLALLASIVHLSRPSRWPAVLHWVVAKGGASSWQCGAVCPVSLRQQAIWAA